MSFHTDKQALEQRYAEAVKQAETIIGGYKVSILNHASRFENKYTIAGTDGNYFATNDKGALLDYLRGVL